MANKIGVRQVPNFINGKFVETDETFQVLYPVTVEVTTKVFKAGKAEVDGVVS